MKGDFSALRFPSADVRSGTMLQQGRVLLDSDWNRQQAIAASWRRAAFSDVVGRAGGPRGNTGFEIGLARGFRLGGPQKQWLDVQAPVAVTLPGAAQADTPPLTIEVVVVPNGGGPIDVIALDQLFSLTLSGASGNLTLSRTASGTSAAPVPVSPVGGKALRIAVCLNEGLLTTTVDGMVVDSYFAGEGWGDPKDYKLYIGRAVSSGGGPDSTMFLSLAELALWRAAIEPAELQARPFRPLTGTEPNLACLLRPSDSDKQVPKLTPQDPTVTATFRNADGGGTQVKVLDYGISIGAGRYYVDGLEVEQGAPTTLGTQPFLPPAADRDLDGRRLVYLDVHEGLLTALRDPLLADPALDGVDTVVAVRSIWQVKTVPYTGNLEQTLDGLADAGKARGALAASVDKTHETPVRDALYRVEIHDGGVVQDTLADPILATPVAKSAGKYTVTGDTPAIAQGDWLIATPQEGTPGRPVRVHVDEVDDDGTLTLNAPPGGGALALALAVPPPSFKWSRRNGCVAFPISDIRRGKDGPTAISLASPGYNGLDLQSGDWVEITNDLVDWGAKPAPLYRVAEVDRSDLVITIDDWAGWPTSTQVFNPILRKWDTSSSMTPALHEIKLGHPIALEDGLQVTFTAESGTQFRPGDYWTFRTRGASASPLPDWPQVGGVSAAMPPEGIEHVIAPLAIVKALDEGFAIETDLRSDFLPLSRHMKEWPR